MSIFPKTVEESSPPNELRVLILGPLRLILKSDEFRIPFPPDGSQISFWNSMFERFPHLRNSHGTIRLARNYLFLLPEEKLEPGDEIALIPPVSGG